MKTKKVWKADAILFPNGNLKILNAPNVTTTDFEIAKMVYRNINPKIKFVNVEIKIVE